MTKKSLYVIITTIQTPTPAVMNLAEMAEEKACFVIIGDRKGPATFDLKGVEFFSLEDQMQLGFDLAGKLPTGHYARKNIGYLSAIRDGATHIYETDDDNAPLPHWRDRGRDVEVLAVEQQGWVNVYRHFSEERIWPRGFPLDAVVASCTAEPALSAPPAMVRAPIQQGLADNSPDVDAVWRLVLDRPFYFRGGPSVLLPPGSWCPFNSQSTWWWPEAYPLMYLPSFCSFRMTDIWRSFIAQRCLWETGYGVVFHPPEVVQDRNEHDLMRDFNDEIPGYQRNREIVRLLEDLRLLPGEDQVAANLRRCYEGLVAGGVFPGKEMGLVEAWLSDLEEIRSGRCAASAAGAE